jgi:hypothetical protein
MMISARLVLCVLALLNAGAGASGGVLEIRLVAEPAARPAFRDALVTEANCSLCERRNVELVDGRTISLLVERDPRVVIPLEEVRLLRAGEARNPLDPSARWWEVIAIFSDEAARVVNAFALAYPAQRVLVAAGGAEPTIDATPGLRAGVLIARFQTKDEAITFTTKLALATEWIASDEQRFRDEERAAREVLEGVPQK